MCCQIRECVAQGILANGRDLCPYGPTKWRFLGTNARLLPGDRVSPRGVLDHGRQAKTFALP